MSHGAGMLLIKDPVCSLFLTLPLSLSSPPAFILGFQRSVLLAARPGSNHWRRGTGQPGLESWRLFLLTS